VSHVKYELGFYIPEDGILHSHRRENLKSYCIYLARYARVSRLVGVPSAVWIGATAPLDLYLMTRNILNYRGSRL
jgi:hypothetical protein